MSDGFKRGLRWIVVIVALFGCYFFLKKGEANNEAGELIGKIGPMLFSLGCLIVAAIAAAPDLARIAALPITLWIDGIFMPVDKTVKPPLDFRLVRHYEQESQGERAVQTYERILQHYPDEVEAWAGLVRVWRGLLDNPKEARRALEKANRRFASNTAAQTLLRQAWQAGEIRAFEEAHKEPAKES